MSTARTLTFFVTAEGKLPIGIKTAMAKIVPNFAGKKVRLSIGEAKEQRSLNQNSYYRGVVLPHVRYAMGEEGDMRSMDTWHEILIEEFSPLVEAVSLHGEAKMRHLRTHEMTMEQMAKFITAVSAEMTSRGYPVPMLESEYMEGGK